MEIYIEIYKGNRHIYTTGNMLEIYRNIGNYTKK